MWVYDRVFSPIKASSLSADRSDFRISRKLVWAPPRHHRILNLVTTYHNNGWRKILPQCSAIFQRFKIALPNCVQLGISFRSVGIQFLFSWDSVCVQLGISLRSVAISWQSVGIQLAFSWQSVCVQLANTNWYPTDRQLIPTERKLNPNWM